jgi:spermidine/putrescine transport system ATP-binding protein
LIEVPQLGNITVFAQNMGQSPVIKLGEQVWISWAVEHSFGLSDLPTKSEKA